MRLNPNVRELLERSVESGSVYVEERDASYVLRSHPSQSQNHGMIFGRLLGLRITFTPFPRYQGFRMFKSWLSTLSFSEKIKSVKGTVIRVVRRGLYRRQPVRPYDANEMNRLDSEK